MKIYTIGFGQKTAENFFEKLKSNEIKKIIDIRLNNKSQLAGFTKKDDIIYFLKEILNIKYEYIPEFAPEKELLDDYRKKKINWAQYEINYFKLLKKRDILAKIKIADFNKACFLCSEPTSEKCHRRLLAEYLKEQYPETEIIHL